MIEIIPNWHPIFVHFSIGLLSIATIFHVLAAIGAKGIHSSFATVANWNLWLGAGISLFTVLAGWFAYNSVNHDTPSHLAMTDHRNWGIATAIVFILISLWSIKRFKKNIAINWTLTIPVLVAATLLLTTGWKGGELVYRHGLGVMSLPKTDDHDHGAHDHSHGSTDSESSMSESDSQHDHPDGHEHDDDHSHSQGQTNEKVLNEESRHEDIGSEHGGQAKEASVGSEAKNSEHTHDHDHGDHAH